MRQDIRRKPDEFCSQTVFRAGENIALFDRPFFEEILNAALSAAQDEPTRKHLERVKKKLDAEDGPRS